MNWRGIGHLGTRYLRRNRIKTGLLVAAFALVWLLPTGIALVVGMVETQLRSRAADTPLVVGHAGSALELTFNALYYTKPGIATIPKAEADRVAESGLADAIPMYARFAAGDHRIVGTTLDYFRFRDLQFSAGRNLLRLGECVVGSRVAGSAGIEVGDAIVSSPETLFDLAGVYPLKMNVVGILEATGSPDDSAIFVDLRTTWIIEGLGHGHQDARETSQEERLESEEAGSIRLNASIVEYNEITEANEESFHFHGDIAQNPITAVIVLPRDAKSQALIKGRYGSSEDRILVSPDEEMEELFATVFSIQSLVLLLLWIVGAGTLAIGALVFLLSYRLRRDEFRHLKLLGSPAATLRALIGFEAVFVLLASLALAAIGLGLVQLLAPPLIESLIG